MQYSVHLPNIFIQTYWRQLLPQWSLPVASVLVVLQQCPIELLDRTVETELHKDHLREQFLTLGARVAKSLRQSDHLATVFDPQTGLPIESLVGELRLDDVAVVRSLLGYKLIEQGGCSAILHPAWGGAVYPSVMLSSASPQIVEQTVRSVLAHSGLVNQKAVSLGVSGVGLH